VTLALAERDRLRRKMRERRRALDDRRANNASLSIARRLQRIPAFQRARLIAGYWPVDGEIDVRPALAAVQKRKATTVLPVLSRTRTGEMSFAAWRADVPMTRNRYGIPEPLPTGRHLFRAANLQVVLVPLLAFDDQGHRIGMGGGYYDRCFAAATRRPCPWPTMIGVGYEHQRLSEIESAPWDVPLSWVVTENALRRCR
jgi:5-formyltetrahydrofolate cyclo-ligase